MARDSGKHLKQAVTTRRMIRERGFVQDTYTKSGQVRLHEIKEEYIQHVWVDIVAIDDYAANKRRGSCLVEVRAGSLTAHTSHRHFGSSAGPRQRRGALHFRQKPKCR